LSSSQLDGQPSAVAPPEAMMNVAPALLVSPPLPALPLLAPLPATLAVGFGL